MSPQVSINANPCTDPECINGIILVNSAYSADPLIPTEQPCDLCNGKGYLVSTKTLED